MQQNYQHDLNAEIDDSKISVINLVCAILAWIVTVIWMYQIFKFSAETGDESSFRSAQLIIFLQTKFNIDFIDVVFIRKAAHVLEYALLSILIYISTAFSNRIIKLDIRSEERLIHLKNDNEIYILISLWISSLFAILDEYHQLFVQGRSGSIIDVCIDAIGIVIMLLIIKIVTSIKYLTLEKKNKF